MGLQGEVWLFVVLADTVTQGDAGKDEPSQPSEIKYELKPADPFSLYGRRLG